MNCLNYLLFALVAFSLLYMAEGFQCYQCEHVEGDVKSFGLKSDSSCKSGKKPKNSLLVTCHFEFEDPVARNCIKVTYENGKNKYTIRGCYEDMEKEDYCADRPYGSSTVIRTKTGNITLPTSQVVEAKENHKTECVCKKDKCNSSTTLAPVLLVTVLFTVFLLFAK